MGRQRAHCSVGRQRPHGPAPPPSKPGRHLHAQRLGRGSGELDAGSPHGVFSGPSPLGCTAAARASSSSHRCCRAASAAARGGQPQRGSGGERRQQRWTGRASRRWMGGDQRRRSGPSPANGKQDLCQVPEAAQNRQVPCLRTVLHGPQVRRAVTQEQAEGAQGEHASHGDDRGRAAAVTTAVLFPRDLGVTAVWIAAFRVWGAANAAPELWPCRCGWATHPPHGWPPCHGCTCHCAIRRAPHHALRPWGGPEVAALAVSVGASEASAATMAAPWAPPLRLTALRGSRRQLQRRRVGSATAAVGLKMLVGRGCGTSLNPGIGANIVQTLDQFLH